MTENNPETEGRTTMTPEEIQAYADDLRRGLNEYKSSRGSIALQLLAANYGNIRDRILVNTQISQADLEKIQDSSDEDEIVSVQAWDDEDATEYGRSEVEEALWFADELLMQNMRLDAPWAAPSMDSAESDQ